MTKWFQTDRKTGKFVRSGDTKLGQQPSQPIEIIDLTQDSDTDEDLRQPTEADYEVLSSDFDEYLDKNYTCPKFRLQESDEDTADYEKAVESHRSHYRIFELVKGVQEYERREYNLKRERQGKPKLTFGTNIRHYKRQKRDTFEHEDHKQPKFFKKDPDLDPPVPKVIRLT